MPQINWDGEIFSTFDRGVSNTHHGQRPVVRDDQVFLLVQFPDRECDGGHVYDRDGHYTVNIPVQPDPAAGYWGMGPDEVCQVLVLI